MKNSADLGGCYPPRPSALVDNTLLDLQNSSYPTQPHSIIAKYMLMFDLTHTSLGCKAHLNMLIENALYKFITVTMRVLQQGTMATRTPQSNSFNKQEQ